MAKQKIEVEEAKQEQSKFFLWEVGFELNGKIETMQIVASDVTENDDILAFMNFEGDGLEIPIACFKDWKYYTRSSVIPERKCE